METFACFPQSNFQVEIEQLDVIPAKYRKSITPGNTEMTFLSIAGLHVFMMKLCLKET